MLYNKSYANCVTGKIILNLGFQGFESSGAKVPSGLGKGVLYSGML
jgi:hypothetical protein